MFKLKFYRHAHDFDARLAHCCDVNSCVTFPMTRTLCSVPINLAEKLVQELQCPREDASVRPVIVAEIV